MRFVVGVDLLADCLGALHLAHWFGDLGVARVEELEAVCVIDPDTLLAVSEYEGGEIEVRASSAVDDQIRRAGVGEAFGETSVIMHSSVSDALLEYAGKTGSALLVGRKNAAGSTMQLGRVLRRLLRSLDVPVGVVPFEFTRPHIGGGPVLIAFEPNEDAMGAVRFGCSLAAGLERPVVLAHVVEPPKGLGHELLSVTKVDRARRDHMEEREAELKAFAEGHGLADVPRLTLGGSPADGLLAAAQAEQACMIVCGSRKLGIVARLFNTSVGTALAAGATCPVFVVPADFDPPA